MMTYLTPFERTGYDLFRSMRDWENEFFGGKASVGNCKTDIRDTGDSYVLEAEMAGFQKDEIHLDDDHGRAQRKDTGGKGKRREEHLPAAGTDILFVSAEAGHQQHRR